jgi:hypothetical protein
MKYDVRNDIYNSHTSFFGFKGPVFTLLMDGVTFCHLQSIEKLPRSLVLVIFIG